MKPIRVKQMELWRYALPLQTPLVSARGTLGEREGLVLKLLGDGGEIGLGEAAPLPGFSAETLEETSARLLGLEAEVEDWSVADPTDVSGLLAELTLPPAAAHAVDQALLGMIAERADVPLAKLLHPVPRAKVPLHALCLGPLDAAAAVQRGFSTLKLKVGAGSITADERTLRAIREAVGPEVHLRADANGAWDLAGAIEAIDRLEAYGLEAIEQPTPSLDDLAEVRAAVNVSIAADECVRTLADLDRLIALSAADALVVKPMLAGGMLAAHALARRAAEAGLAVSVTGSFESRIGRRASEAVAAACPGTLWTCGLDTGRWLAADLDPLALSIEARAFTPHRTGLLSRVASTVALAEVIPFPLERRLRVRSGRSGA